VEVELLGEIDLLRHVGPRVLEPARLDARVVGPRPRHGKGCRRRSVEQLKPCEGGGDAVGLRQLVLLERAELPRRVAEPRAFVGEAPIEERDRLDELVPVRIVDDL
jgi:hypothetical protein